MSKVKILYFHHGGGNGGAAQSLLYLLKGLDRNRYEPIVACDFAAPGARHFFEMNGFDPVHVPSSIFFHVYPSGWWPLYSPVAVFQLLKWAIIKYPRSVMGLKKILDEVKPDLVHLNSLTIVHLARVAKGKGISVVLHVRESASIKGHVGLRWRWLRWLTCRFVDRVIYICSDNERSLTGPVEFGRVIYNPVPFEKFDRRIEGGGIREKLGIDPECIVLFFPGGSSDLPKGIIPFLNALVEVRKGHADVIALIPGLDGAYQGRDNSTQNKIESLIRGKKLESSIIRVPFSEEVELYFAASDIVVVPFVVPHFSRAVLEAGAMEKPVIGSRIGGVEEVIVDGVTGLLVIPEDAADLADKLLRLVTSANIRTEMGSTGYEKAYSFYSAERHAKAVMDVYDMIYPREEMD